MQVSAFLAEQKRHATKRRMDLRQARLVKELVTDAVAVFQRAMIIKTALGLGGRERVGAAGELAAGSRPIGIGLAPCISM